MKTAFTFSIDFIIRLNKKDRTLALIYARITVNGDIKEISLKEQIKAAVGILHVNRPKGNQPR